MDKLRELAGQWREAGKEAMRAGHRSGNPEYGEICRAESIALNKAADELDALRAQLAGGGDDAARLDALERLIDQQPGKMLLLHHGYGAGKGIGGLGLSNTRRTLRQAIDDSAPPIPTKETES